MTNKNDLDLFYGLFITKAFQADLWQEYMINKIYFVFKADLRHELIMIIRFDDQRDYVFFITKVVQTNLWQWLMINYFFWLFVSHDCSLIRSLARIDDQWDLFGVCVCVYVCATKPLNIFWMHDFVRKWVDKGVNALQVNTAPRSLISIVNGKIICISFFSILCSVEEAKGVGSEVRVIF